MILISVHPGDGEEDGRVEDVRSDEGDVEAADESLAREIFQAQVVHRVLPLQGRGQDGDGDGLVGDVLFKW